jgi:hypothetical protein
MGKKVPTKQRLQTLIENGWRFRVKTVKKRRYITMRKRQMERSLGPYDEDLWKRIQSIKKRQINQRELSTQESEDIERAWRREISRSRERYHMLLKFERSRVISTSCRHIVDRFCHFWIWQDEPSFLKDMKKAYNPDAMLVNKLDNGKLVLRADPLYCSGCPAYERR